MKKIVIFALLVIVLGLTNCATGQNRAGESLVKVKGEGDTALENTVIRWMVDSEPRGANVYWRAISSHSDVQNTNESYMGKTPFEETRTFDIKGLSVASAGNVQIEIRVEKSGFHEQRKRYNLQQALDQKEISGLFTLTPEDE